MHDLKLRSSTDEDIPFLYRVYASTRADEMALLDWSDADKQSFLKMQFDAQHRHYHAHYDNARFDIIELDGTPVGRLYIDNRSDEIRLIDIALLPDFRGRGVGTGLIQQVIDTARQSNRSVTIHVEGNNPAIGLYKRLGFRYVKDVGVYHFMQWHSKPPGVGEEDLLGLDNGESDNAIAGHAAVDENKPDQEKTAS